MCYSHNVFIRMDIVIVSSAWPNDPMTNCSVEENFEMIEKIKEKRRSDHLNLMTF